MVHIVTMRRVEKQHSLLGPCCIGGSITIPYGAHCHNAKIESVLGNHHSGSRDGSDGEKESDNVKNDWVVNGSKVGGCILNVFFSINDYRRQTVEGSIRGRLSRSFWLDYHSSD
jgi:hypothetical protein